MKIHFLSGMGADSRIWNGYRESFPDGQFHNWILKYGKDMGICDYSKELIKSINISDDDMIVGVSMGGIVGAEIQNQMPDVKLIQISSCTNYAQLNRFVGCLSPIGKIMPFGKLASVPNALMPNTIMELTNTMYKESDYGFIKWACMAIPKWSGHLGKGKITKILGNNDFIFPIKKQSPDFIIQGGTHLMVMTHFAQITKILQSCVQPA